MAGITYVHTREGFLHLAFVLDVYSRRIVGWAMESHFRTEFVTDALRMAVWGSKPAPGLVHHADQEAQYTSSAFGERSKEVAITPSWGEPGPLWTTRYGRIFRLDAKDRVGEQRPKFPTRQATRTAIFDYLEPFYNTRRLHSALGYRSPVNFEENRGSPRRVRSTCPC